MTAHNAVAGAFARKRTLGLLALLTLVSSCLCEESMGEGACLGMLRLNSSLALNNIYADDEWDVLAELSGNTANCGNLSFNWTVSNNLTVLQNLANGVRLRANAAGPAFVNAGALNTPDLTARIDWDVLRSTGDLNVTASIPDNGAISYRLSGNGFDQTYTTPQLIPNLNAGAYDWEALEVLRGPQGTLYGANPSSGVVNITRNAVTDLSLSYQLQNVEMRVRYDVPTGVTGPFGRIVGSGVDYTFTEADRTYGFEPGSYTIENYDLDPVGYKFAPNNRNEALSLSLGVQYLKEYDFTAERGQIIVGTTGAPAGIEDKAKLIDPMGGTWDIMLPYSGYVAPGNWEVQNNRAVFEDADNDRITYFTPRFAGFQLSVTAGQDTEVQYEYDVSFWRTDWNTSLTVSFDFWNHKDFVQMPAQMNLQLWEDQKTPGVVKVKGVMPFATVTGTLDQNGQLSATGTGVAAGFSNVPFTLTGAVDWTAGTLSGELEVGQETAPTGLPNGPIRYALLGARITF